MRSSCLVVAGVGVLCTTAALAATDSQITALSPITKDSPSAVDFYVADQFTYDGNLYRLPAYFDIKTVAGPKATRQDSFDSATLGGDGRWFSDNQALALNFRADENRFTHNDTLNNVSGKGNLEWDWRLETLWSGQVGASYYRGLANFGNTGYYARDVVEREDYFGTLRYQVGPHWAIYGGFIGADTSQTAVAEQLYDYRSEAGNAGVEFATSADNTVSFEYRFTDATFPRDFILDGKPFNSNYQEDTARVLVKYVVTAATELDVTAGYLRRGYPESSFAAYSGDVWRAALQWQPRDALQVVLTGWRDLAAYVEAQSDYFVSTGVSLGPVWTATEALTLSVLVGKEKHDYIDSSPSTIAFVSRRDRLTTEQARLVYSPTQSLGFDVSYRYDQRQSNLSRYRFDDTLATASVTFKIRP